MGLSKALIILTIVIFSSYSFAQKTVKLAVEDSWAPFSDPQGNGISKEIIQAAFDAMDMNVEFQVMPYIRALHMVEIGLIDGAFNVTKQKNTLEKFNFGEEPILTAITSFFYTTTSKFNFNSVDEIPDGTTIALISGYEYGDAYESNKHRFKETRVSLQSQIINLLLRKRAQMAIMFDQVAAHNLVEMNLTTTTLRKGHISDRNTVFVAFSKKRNTSGIMRALDEGLRKTRGNKTHQQD